MSLILEKKLPFGHFLVYNEAPPFPCRSVKQVHGKEITMIIDKNQYTEDLEADGLMMTLMNDMPILAIKTADCLPIAVLGHRGVALLHAGWRGVKEEIVNQKKIEALNPYYFYIGPHIQSCCYEVQNNFLENFPSSPHQRNENGKTYFSLLEEVRSQLTKAYPDAQVEFSSICTHCDPDFHSFRRDNTTKRNWNLLLC